MIPGQNATCIKFENIIKFLEISFFTTVYNPAIKLIIFSFFYNKIRGSEDPGIRGSGDPGKKDPRIWLKIIPDLITGSKGT
jgi:hypothetical protein